MIKGKNILTGTLENPYFSIFQAVLLIIILLHLLPPGHLHAQPSEYQVKSLLLSRISSIYIEWPEEVELDNPNKPFVIAIYGENSFGSYLKQEYGPNAKPKKIRNKSVELRYIKDIEEISECHLLFVSELDRRTLTRVIEFTQERPILTMTDTEGYARRGIHINFVVEKTAVSLVKGQQIAGKRKQNIGLVINETAIRQSGLVISEELLKNATEIIKPYKPYEEKAIHIAPITRFTTWPPEMIDPSRPFKIEIIGHKDFGSSLEKIYKKKKLKNMPVIIRYISKLKEIRNPHILIISKSMKEKITEIISYTKNKPILTIGDTPGFHKAGVHINFYYDRLKLSLEINEEAAIAAGLKMTHHLLRRNKPRKPL